MREALDEYNLPIESAELQMVPTNMLELDPETQVSVAKLIEALEDLDDVQQVFVNVDFDEDVLEQFAA